MCALCLTIFAFPISETFLYRQRDRIICETYLKVDTLITVYTLGISLEND